MKIHTVHRRLVCCSWGKKPGHNRAQILFYVAENLDTRRAEFASQLMLCTDCTLEEGQRQVDLSVHRLFHWAAYCDKHGGSVQVSICLLGKLYYCKDIVKKCHSLFQGEPVLEEFVL